MTYGNVNDLNKHELIEWVLHHVGGASVPATIHCEGNDFETRAIPIEALAFIMRDLKGSIEP
jgi:hypothetical protein